MVCVCEAHFCTIAHKVCTCVALVAEPCILLHVPALPADPLMQHPFPETHSTCTHPRVVVHHLGALQDGINVLVIQPLRSGRLLRRRLLAICEE